MRSHAGALTADFRRYYGARVRDFGALEAADLAANLPRESASMRALDPSAAWGDAEYLLWSIEFSLRVIRYGLAGCEGQPPEPLPRPAGAADFGDVPTEAEMAAVAEVLGLSLEGDIRV